MCGTLQYRTLLLKAHQYYSDSTSCILVTGILCIGGDIHLHALFYLFTIYSYIILLYLIFPYVLISYLFRFGYLNKNQFELPNKKIKIRIFTEKSSYGNEVSIIVFVMKIKKFDKGK